MSKKHVHVFENHCIDFDEILSKTKISQMIDVAMKQSKTEEAKKRVDSLNYKDYGPKEFCPIYFGMFVEWLAAHFLEYYGHVWNIEGVQMLDVFGNTEIDLGVDAEARTIREQKNNKKFTDTHRHPVKGSPVYIQVKGTDNASKVFKPNDGSRLPNFMCNAQGKALCSGKSYQARYVLFTTGEGIHYTMDQMSCKAMEVINIRDIKRHMDNDIVFLNTMRVSVGLEELPTEPSQKDQEATMIEKQNLLDAEEI